MMKPSLENPTPQSPETPPQSETQDNRKPEIVPSPEEMGEKEKEIAIRAINLKSKFKGASGKEIGEAFYRFERGGEKTDHARRMEKWSGVLNITESAKWEDFEDKIRELEAKDLKLSPAAIWEAIIAKESEIWLKENWSTPETRKEKYKEFDWYGEKVRAWVNDKENYLEEWKNIDNDRITQAFKKYGGKVKDLPKSDGFLTDRELVDMAPKAFALDGQKMEEREEMMRPEVASKMLLEQLKNGQIDRIVIGADDADARLAVRIFTDFNKLGDKIRVVSQVSNGQWMRNAINIDTGNRPAGLVGEGKKTYFFDHHQEHRTEPTSGAKLVFEWILEHDLLPDTYDGMNKAELRAWLERAVKFVTEVDNASHLYINEKNADGSPKDKDKIDAEKQELEKFYKNDFAKSLYGLYNNLPFEELLKLLKEDRDWRSPLSDDYLAKISAIRIYKIPPSGEEKTDIENLLRDTVERVKGEVISSIDTIRAAEEEMKRKNIKNQHPILGKVLVNFKESTKLLGQEKPWEEQVQPAHREAAYALGYDTQITFSQADNKFWIQSRKDLSQMAEEIKKSGYDVIIARGSLAIPKKGGKEYSELLTNLGLWDQESFKLKGQENTEADGFVALGFDPNVKPTPDAIHNAIASKVGEPVETIARLQMGHFLKYKSLAADLKKAIELGKSRKRDKLIFEGEKSYTSIYINEVLMPSIEKLGIKASVKTRGKKIEVAINYGEESVDANETFRLSWLASHGLQENAMTFEEIMSKEAKDAGLDPEIISKLPTEEVKQLIDDGKTAKILRLRSVDEYRKLGMEKFPREKEALLRAVTEGELRQGLLSASSFYKTTERLDSLGYTFEFDRGNRDKRRPMRIWNVRHESRASAETDSRFVTRFASILGIENQNRDINAIAEAVGEKVGKPKELILRNKMKFLDVPQEWVSELINERRNKRTMLYQNDARRTEWKTDILRALEII